MIEEIQHNNEVFKLRSKRTAYKELITLGILLAVSVVLYINLYYIHSDLISLVVLLIPTPLCFLNFTSPLSIVLFTLPLMHVSIFGRSPAFYLFPILFTIELMKRKTKTLNFGMRHFLLLFLILMGIKDVIAYERFEGLSYVVSIIFMNFIIMTYSGKVILQYIKKFMGVSLITFGFFQLITGKLNTRWIGSNITFQLAGTYEPNYYSFYLTLFFVVLLYEEGSNIIKKALLFIILFLIIVAQSMTGYLSISIVLGLYFFFSWRKSTISKLFLTFSVITLLLFSIILSWEWLAGFLHNTRIGFLITAINQKVPLSTITSYRSVIFQIYLQNIFKRDLLELLFGKLYNEIYFIPQLGRYMFSHNFFIDLMNQVGIVGTIFFILYFIRICDYLRVIRNPTEFKISLSIILVFIVFFLNTKVVFGKNCVVFLVFNRTFRDS
ncbi:hypothetical protein TRQ7_01595 [Thermotoga sp. RQ7]|nr:hypothetical protein TRQ7_01595 [Thermotoga sp. RQ7]